jgi:hypothetical protein
MTDANALRLRIAVDLREIQHLYADLRAEAVSHADDPDLPGGDAMVMLGPSADPEAWSYRQLSAALGRTEPHGLYENDADPQPPLLVLATWEDCIRQELQTPTDKRATIEGAAKFLASSIDWCLDTDEAGDVNFIAIDDMAADIAKVRRRLEAVLHATKQRDLGVDCLNGCGEPLLKIWGIDEGTDRYVCVVCKRRYEVDEYHLAVKQAYMLAAEWLTADHMAAVYRVPSGTVAVWANRDHVRKRVDPNSRRIVYNVADVIERRDASA